MVRIQMQRRGVLITLLMNTDVNQVSSRRERSVADVEEAVEAVREFLAAFVASVQA